MKKMYYDSIICEVSVLENAVFLCQVPCEYEKDVIAYAAERFFAKTKDFRKECTRTSWRIRLAKGKERKKQPFQCIVPAIAMELPGSWATICGFIDEIGVKIERIELSKDHPFLSDRKKDRGR